MSPAHWRVFITSAPSVAFVKATHPPKPNGVGAGRLSIVTTRSLRGMLSWRTARA